MVGKILKNTDYVYKFSSNTQTFYHKKSFQDGIYRAVIDKYKKGCDRIQN